MKIRIRMKSPDAVDSSVHEAAYDVIAERDGDELKDLDVEELVQQTKEDPNFTKWVGHGEYITVVIDTDEGTAVVEEAR